MGNRPVSRYAIVKPHARAGIGHSIGVFIFLAIAILPLAAASTTQAHAQTKSLKLYYLHTGEKAEIVFKRNGSFVQSGLKKINWFLRDWRRNEPTKMDPNLLDLVWEVYRKTGSKNYIHVISGYRSPASNAMLRKRGRGVAKNSQHTRGKALDFFIPGVKLSTLRALGLKMEVGGVGYYPSSGSPFVHMDTGRVRHWPRMSRKQLARVFPGGKTMHIPSDGKPLARYEQAVAAYKSRTARGKLVPQSKPTAKELNFFQRLARLGKNDEDDEADAVAAPRTVKTVKNPQPKAKPTPVPIEEKEVLLATIAKRVPVPVSAPRPVQKPDVPVIEPKPVEAAQPILVASNEAAEAAEELANNKPLEEQQPGKTLVAALQPPVPVRRPQFNATPAITEPKANPTSELALVQSEDNASNNGQQVAALTDDEIMSLRTSARPVSAERAITAQVSTAARRATDANVELASLNQQLDTATTGLIAVPEPNPLNTQEAQEAQALRRKQAEQQRLAEIARLEAEKKASERAAQIAAAEAEKARIQETRTQLASAEVKPSLAQRTVSLDRYSAPQNNKSTIGKWALAADTTIKALSEVQPPAYGRNVIRQVNGPVVLQGFKFQAFGPGKNSFKGRAVQASKFARL